MVVGLVPMFEKKLFFIFQEKGAFNLTQPNASVAQDSEGASLTVEMTITQLTSNVHRPHLVVAVLHILLHGGHLKVIV